MQETSSTVSLSTSKINYMDPRITVAWYVNPAPFPFPARCRPCLCKALPVLRKLPKLTLTLTCESVDVGLCAPDNSRCKKFDVPIDNSCFFSKSLLGKFTWAMSASAAYKF
eukprot:SAG22_NODE_4896_length_1137_cov_2100.506744_1_plen_111_part_00